MDSRWLSGWAAIASLGRSQVPNPMTTGQSAHYPSDHHEDCAPDWASAQLAPGLSRYSVPHFIALPSSATIVSILCPLRRAGEVRCFSPLSFSFSSSPISLILRVVHDSHMHMPGEESLTAAAIHTHPHPLPQVPAGLAADRLADSRASVSQP